MQKQNEKLIFLNTTDSEKSILTAEDVQQNKADVEPQGSPEEPRREASGDANTSDDQKKEDREKRKEAKVGGTCFNHHRAHFSVPEPTIDLSGLFVVRVSQQFPTISR